MLHIDGIIFRLQSHGGISVCYQELLPRLVRGGLPLQMSLETPGLGQVPQVNTHAVARPARLLERYRPCRTVMDASGVQLFHSTYYRLPADRRLASVVTVHDFAYERWVGGPRAWLHSLQKFAALRAAQAIVCVSESTRNDLLELCPPRAGQEVHVVPNGVGDDFYPLASASLPPSARPFLLFVGQRGRYKNFELALQALALLPPDMALFCVGGGPLQPQELACLSEPNRSRVQHLGGVSNAQLNLLYNQALALLYPSAYEGFGIPVLEALRAGCPAIGLAECRAVVEVGGDALCIAASHPEALASAVRQEILVPSRRAHWRSVGLHRAQLFSWARNGEQWLAHYRRWLNLP